MKLTYTKQGDYLIPDITIRQPRKALGHYGTATGKMMYCR